MPIQPLAPLLGKVSGKENYPMYPQMELESKSGGKTYARTSIFNGLCNLFCCHP